jgi:hypothetical protein
MKLSIASDDREHAILVCDADHNDIAEFFHSDHATVEQSYETALMLARKLVDATNGGPFFSTQWEREDHERRQRGLAERGPVGSRE